MKEIDWELIISYLEGNSTKEEEKKINEWIQADVENKKEIDLLKKIWNVPDVPLPKADVEEALMNVVKRTRINADSKDLNTASILRLEPQEKRKPFIQWISSNRILKVAAILLFMIATSYIVSIIIKPTSMNTIVVEYEKQEKITLTDGTQVTLDAGSIFNFPQKFNSEKREVFLNGEGYFEVIPDQEKPFIVHANNAVITVLGTKFNIRAWDQTKRVVVVVGDGKVSLRPRKILNKKAEVIISKDQTSLLKGNDIPSVPQYTNVNEHLAWLNHEMYFKSTPLHEVLGQLERWYNLEFYLPNESYKSNRITVFIQNKPIEEILDLISLINNFQFERNGNKIIFSPLESK